MQTPAVTTTEVGHWHRLPRESVDAPTLEMSKLDGAWSNLGEWEVSLPMAESWNVSSFPT